MIISMVWLGWAAGQIVEIVARKFKLVVFWTDFFYDIFVAFCVAGYFLSFGKCRARLSRKHTSLTGPVCADSVFAMERT